MGRVGETEGETLFWMSSSQIGKGKISTQGKWGCCKSRGKGCPRVQVYGMSENVCQVISFNMPLKDKLKLLSGPAFTRKKKN